MANQKQFTSRDRDIAVVSAIGHCLNWPEETHPVDRRSIETSCYDECEKTGGRPTDDEITLAIDTMIAEDNFPPYFTRSRAIEVAKQVVEQSWSD